MMDNLTTNKSHIPCQSWAGQNGWSTTSAQGSLHNPLPSSQHLSLGSSSDQRASYSHMQESNQSCMSDLSALSSRNNTHHSALYKASHINPSSNALFANTAIPSASHIISFAQQTPHTSSMLLNASQGKNIHTPSLPQTNQAPQPCRTQHHPLFSSHDPYKASFQPPLSNQSLPNGLLSCEQHVSTSQATFEGACVEFAGVAGHTHSHASSTSQEQSQWIPSSHCRGAVNECVPDTNVHPKTKPSQEGKKTNSPASNERQRLLILHQRAELLQQVAALDKLLESIPPEDSCDGKSLRTAVQSPPLMDDSAECEPTKTSDAQQVQRSARKSKSQSHLSSDKQNKVCDTPEDPMSAAESEKEEIVSAESEYDSDPDYLPNNDGDFSDVLSDSDRGSPDESSHNRRPTPTDKKPSRPEKKKAKSGSSLFKDENVSPPKKIRAANQKLSEIVVMPRSTSKRQPNYCLFCSRAVTKLPRHFECMHSDKPEVAAAFQYPKHSKERQKIWNRLTNEGNFAHNKDVLMTGKGKLAVRQRPRKPEKAQNFVHCLYCRGLFMKKLLFKHFKSCPEKVVSENERQLRAKPLASRCALEAVGDLGLSEGFRNVLGEMQYDDVTRTIMEDEVLLQFGELMFSQYGSDPKKNFYIRQNLRQMARLVLEAKTITPLKKLEDFFLPSSFPHVVSAVNVLAGYNPENKTYHTPSLALKLGCHLQKTCSIVEDNAVKSGNAHLAESAQDFLSLYQQQWNKLISADALISLRKIKSNAAKKVPFAEDIKLLNFHMENVHLLAEKKLRDNPSTENYVALAKVILARTIVCNRRSVEEVSSMQLTAFMSRKKSSSHDGMDVSVSDLEKNMCKCFTRVDIRGKCGRTVPILLKPSLLSAMELLVEVRKTCGIPSRNPFLFARPNALSPYRGSYCIQQYVKECGAKDPDALTCKNILKHYGKMLLLMNLDENEANQILGPNNQVRSLRQNSSMQLNDVNMHSDERAASWDLEEPSTAHYGPADLHHGARTDTYMTAHVPPKPRKKGSKYKGKSKWEEAEVLAVERHMMHLIEEHKVPQKNDCIQCLEAEPQALRTRSWKGVKDYVRNRITTLKRQSSSSQATPSKRHRPDDVKPQQITGHY